MPSKARTALTASTLALLVTLAGATVAAAQSSSTTTTTLPPTTTTTITLGEATTTTLAPTTTTTLIATTTTTVTTTTTLVGPTTTLTAPSSTTTTTTTTTTLPACGNGTVDAGETCGEPALPSCSVGKTCVACDCLLRPAVDFAIDDRRQTVRRGNKRVYRLIWSTPGISASGAQITVSLGSELHVLKARSADPVIVDGNQVTISLGNVVSGSRGKARIKFGVRVDAPLGSDVTSQARYTDADGRDVTTTDTVTVNTEQAPNSIKLGLKLKGTKAVSNGGKVRYKVKYSNASPTNSLAMSLPTTVTITKIKPSPTSRTGGDLTWDNARSGSDDATVRGIVILPGGATVSGSVVVSAAMTDGSGDSAADAEVTTVSEASGDPDTLKPLSLTGRSKGGFKPGKRNILVFDYRRLLGTGSLSVTLPAMLGVDIARPAGATITVEGGNTIVTWSDLSKKKDDVRIEAIIDEAAVRGQVLPVSATVSDDDEQASVGFNVILR